MKRITFIRIKYAVEVEIECTEPEKFKNNYEFRTQDGKEIGTYIQNQINAAVASCWNKAAHVTRCVVKQHKY